MKKLNYLFIAFLMVSITMFAQQNEKEAINNVLDGWHKDAANADFESYFGRMTEDGVFLGTDAMENWQNDEFRAFSKPYFDRGKAWSFTAVERNIYVDESGEFAWFDELLDTQMKICRENWCSITSNDYIYPYIINCNSNVYCLYGKSDA